MTTPPLAVSSFLSPPFSSLHPYLCFPINTSYIYSRQLPLLQFKQCHQTKKQQPFQCKLSVVEIHQFSRSATQSELPRRSLFHSLCLLNLCFSSWSISRALNLIVFVCCCCCYLLLVALAIQEKVSLFLKAKVQLQGVQLVQRTTIHRLIGYSLLLLLFLVVVKD